MAGIPFVGDDIQRSVADLAAATFGNAAQTGQTVTDAVTMAANVLALVTFLAPAAVLLVLWLPRRLDRARAWDAGYRVLAAVPTPPGYPLPAGPPSADPAGASPAADGQATLALPWPPGTGAQPLVGSPRARAGDQQVAFPPDELLALRALCHLPFEDLVRFTPRPFEAFATGDFAPLVAALYAHEGMAPPSWAARS
jgi:hypothetical protein